MRMPELHAQTFFIFFLVIIVAGIIVMVNTNELTGKAVNEFGEEIAEPASAITCSDSDGGKDFGKKGTTVGVRAWWEVNPSNVKQEVDSCTTVCQGSVGSGVASEGQCLIEYYCSSHPQTGGPAVFAAFDVKQCEFGCKDGACVSSPSAPALVDTAISLVQIRTKDGTVNQMNIPANTAFEVETLVTSRQPLPSQLALTYVNVGFSRPGIGVGGEKDIGNFGTKYGHVVNFQGLAAGDYSMVLSVRTVCKSGNTLVECQESQPGDNEVKIPVKVVEPSVSVVDLGLKIDPAKAIKMKRTSDIVQPNQIPENEPFFVAVKVENVGDADTAAEVNGQIVIGGNVQFLGGELIGMLKKGSIGEANIGIDGLKPGNYPVYANIANKDDKMTSNNQVRIDLTVIPAPVQPQVKQWKDSEVITFDAKELLFSRENAPLRQNEIPENTQIKARFFVVNTAAEARVLNLKAFVDGKQVGEASTGGKVMPEKSATVWLDIPTLQQGQHTLQVQHEDWAISVQLAAVAPKPTGVYDVAVEVDPQRFILYNNQYVTELTPEQAQGGFLISFTIRNKGTVLAQPVYTIPTGATKPVPESVGELLGQNGRKEITKAIRLYLPDNKIRIEATPTASEGADADMSNNVVVIPVNIVQQKLQPDGYVEWDIRATPNGDKVFQQDTFVYAHELQANKHTLVRVRARNVDREEVSAVLIAEIDGKEVSSQSIKIDGQHDTFVTLDLKVLQGGEKSLTVRLKVDNDRNTNNNVVTTPLTVTGQAQQIAPNIDLSLDGAVLSQELKPGVSFKRKADDVLKVAGDQSLLVELLVQSNVKDMPKFARWWSFIDGYKYKSHGVDVQSFTIDKIQTGPHKVKLVIDSENLVAETNENNNAFEFSINVVTAAELAAEIEAAQIPPPPVTPTPVQAVPPAPVQQPPAQPAPQVQPPIQPAPVQLDLGIAPNSNAVFDDAAAKSAGVNSLEINIYFTGDAKTPVPVIMTLGKQKMSFLRAPGQGSLKVKIPIKDRKQFPTQVHVIASAPEPDISNNVVTLPVVVKKDGKLFLLSAAQPTPPAAPIPPPQLPVQPVPIPTIPVQPAPLPCPSVDSRGWECFSRTRYVSCSEGYEVATPLASTSCTFCCMPKTKPACRVDVSNCPEMIKRFFTTTMIYGEPSKGGDMCTINNDLLSNVWNRNWGLYYWKFNAPCGRVIQRQ